MSEHTWFQENLAGYSAGGLTAEERERFQRHRTACGTCARALAEFQGFDEAINNLFTEVRPAEGWENRVIHQFRVAPRWHVGPWSKWARLAAAVAALVVLGTLGAVLHGFVIKGNLPFPGMTARYAGVIGSIDYNGPALVRDGGTVLMGGLKVDQSESRARNTDGEIYNVLRSGGDSDKKTAVSGEGLDRDLAESLQIELKHKLLVLDGVTARVDVDTLEDSKSVVGLQPEADPFSITANGRSTYQTSIPGGFTTIGLGTGTMANYSRGPKTGEYFNPSLGVMVYKLDPGKSNPQGVDKKEGKTELSRLGKGGGEKGKEPGKTEPPPEKKPADFGLPAEAAPRKIIRTGEIEFEVDGFDAAVTGIKRLVGDIKGGFVTTVNSDKLPNGKVRGSMVVRLPPEKLDKFLLDVRQELAKTGELKSQRIGSQDVTKQYTDIESRLRGARVMEERFLQIIKTGKGEIKDLIAAENALGIWRIKIEEMEGEIRYYNNQVGLSTLTITLSEKEIQAPAALVVTERLKIQLEVEDVKKAQQTALAAVAEAKGRVTKSDLKQHAAGQLEAILHFEVAPAAAEQVRERLEKLGVVTHQDSDRSQQSEGAGSGSPDIKIKLKDVQFEVVLYNVANIQPREVLVIQLATLDVHAGFDKLKEAVAKAKGQVRTAQLKEQPDKLKVSAQFDFDIPNLEKKAIDQALVDVGKVIARNTTQAPPGEAATDRKVGYRLALLNVAVLPPRETVSLAIEVKNVDKASADIIEMVKTRQGRVGAGQTNQERNGRFSGLLRFDVPLTAKDELLLQLKAAGTTLLQTTTRNPQAPDNELATAHFDVTLTSSGPIVPSDEGLWPQVRTSLFYSFKLLSWSLMFVILGLSVILPWVLVLWGAYKVVSKWRKKPAAT